MAQNQELIKLHQIKDALMAPTSDQQEMAQEGEGSYQDVDEEYFSTTMLDQFKDTNWSASYEEYGFTPQKLKVKTTIWRYVHITDYICIVHRMFKIGYLI